MAAMTLEGLTERLVAAHGDELVAVVLYGSAARGERVEKRSDYNVLLIVRSLTPSGLHGALDFAARAAAITCSRRGADMPQRAELR